MPNVFIAAPRKPVMAIQIAPMLVVDGEPGSTAQVSYAESAMPTQWTVITNFVLGAGTFTWCDPMARAGQRRYEVVSVPPNPSPNPRSATGTVAVVNGFVVTVTVSNGGEGYLTPPSVTIVGGGSGATAGAMISNGVVTQVTVTNSGSGYSSASVVFSAPPRVTRLTEHRVPQVTVRYDPSANVVVQSTATLAGTNRWTGLAILGTSSNGVVWFDMSATQAMGRFYRVAALSTVNPDPDRLIGIPVGTFRMGSPASEVGRSANEGPQTQVTLTRGFFMGRYEVTQREYLSLIGSNPSGFTGDTNRPVERVTWNEAANYCVQLTVRERSAGRLPEGWTYRLPTEAEWEYASRAGSTNRFSYGENPENTDLGNYAWFDLNSGGATHTVGGKLPNAWGLHDVAGNVFEWCSDRYGNYSGGNVADPQGPASGSNRVYRGGSYFREAIQCRSAFRGNLGPTERYNRFGFRVVLAPVQP